MVNIKPATKKLFNEVKQSELQIWSLRISDVQRISACNCVLAFPKHDRSTQYG